MKILVTGGAGFIGSEVVRQLCKNEDFEIHNLDSLTYAGNLQSLTKIENNKNYHFHQIDLRKKSEVEKLLMEVRPIKIMHLAAESHVDNSISNPGIFFETNVMGTYNLLDSSLKMLDFLETSERKEFRFHHISTDEVFGSLKEDGLFAEDTPYAPNSPYSASKASSDHLVRAWHHTYNLPVITTNCSNNYGPYQYPEKLIPKMILNAIQGKELPIYGNGKNIRDWLYVEDHADALIKILFEGKIGETYNIGGHNEIRNVDIVTTICKILDSKIPLKKGAYSDQIKYVPDRLGHDFRYAIDASKIERELQWKPAESFETGIEKTIDWYLNNKAWWSQLI